jgi:hypothetical protein
MSVVQAMAVRLPGTAGASPAMSAKREYYCRLVDAPGGAFCGRDARGPRKSQLLCSSSLSFLR